MPSRRSSAWHAVWKPLICYGAGNGSRYAVAMRSVVSSVPSTACSIASRANAKRAAAASWRLRTPETELAVYRIAQESLTNIARHAAANQVTIALDSGPGRIVLRVADDGRGFAGVPEENGGLRSMRERSLLVGGTLAIKPAPEGGV